MDIAATATRPLDWLADFPAIPEGWAYLDSAATAQKPQAVIDAITRGYAETYATVHRGVYQRSAEMTVAFEASRRAGRPLHRRRRARGDRLRPRRDRGDQPRRAKLGPRQSEARRPHPALDARASLQHRPLAAAPGARDRRRAAHRRSPHRSRRDGGDDPPEHKLVALAHVSNVLGSVLDATRAAEIAHGVGAKLLLDGCQAVPRMPVDVAALDCDFYVFSGHKLYGPTGIGVLWARAELLDAMPPWQGGGAMIDKVTLRAHHLCAAAGAVRGGDAARRRRDRPPCRDRLCRRASASTPSPRTRRRWSREARDALSGLNSVRLFGPEDSAGIVSFAVEGVHPHDVGTILDESRVAIRAGHHCAQPLMAASRRRRDRAGELRGL